MEQVPDKMPKSVKLFENFAKMNWIIYTLDTICIPNIMTIAQAVLQIFSSQDCFTIQNAKVKNERYSVIYLQNFAKRYSCHIHLGHNLDAKYHDPNSSG